MRILEHFSPGSLIVIVVTFVLFTFALFTHGFAHTLLIEAAVFLVSVKLMLMTYRNSISAKRLEKKMEDIHESIKELHSKIK